MTKLQIILVALGAIALAFGLEAISTEVQSVDPCKLTVITAPDGKVDIVRPSALDYEHCQKQKKEDTKRIPASRRLFGKKCGG